MHWASSDRILLVKASFSVIYLQLLSTEVVINRAVCLQFPGFPQIPVAAMTQQATRHARRVYVGGLPPMANEQVRVLCNAQTHIRLRIVAVLRLQT
jgi:hypothetical protein